MPWFWDIFWQPRKWCTKIRTQTSDLLSGNPIFCQQSYASMLRKCWILPKLWNKYLTYYYFSYIFQQIKCQLVLWTVIVRAELGSEMVTYSEHSGILPEVFQVFPSSPTYLYSSDFLVTFSSESSVTFPTEDRILVISPRTCTDSTLISSASLRTSWRRVTLERYFSKTSSSAFTHSPVMLSANLSREDNWNKKDSF